jgi:predicted glutamine amidotransferase
MCVIIAGAAKRPSLKTLKQCERQNPDGAGLAWLTDDGVSVRKGLDAEQLHKLLRSLPERTPFVAHFRFTTVGDSTPQLTHPFIVSKTSPARVKADGLNRVLFHNGTIPFWQQLLDETRSKQPAGAMSDSRAMAVHLASAERNGRFFPTLDAVPGKFVVLDKQGPIVYPTSLEGWHERGGCFYSNLRWRPRTSSRPSRKAQEMPSLPSKPRQLFQRR